MAIKAFGVKELRIDGSGTPTIESPGGGNLNVTAATATFSGNLAVNGNLTVSGTGGGGSSTFLSLTDTPANYTSQAGKILKVNSGTNALEFSNVEAITISTAESTDDNNTYNIPFLTSTGGGGAQKGLQVDNGGLWFNPGTNYFGCQNILLGGSNNFPGYLTLYNNAGNKFGQINGIPFGIGNNSSSTTNVIIGQTTTGAGIGGFNVALGYGAFQSTGTNAAYNVALGFQALLGNDGAYNVALGDNALSGTGSYNIGIGRQTGQQINGAQFNIFMGYQCARVATSIGHCFVAGFNALDSVTSGLMSGVSGTGNNYGHIAIGYNSQKEFQGVDQNGAPNISMGIFSLENNIMEGANIAIGNNAMRYLGLNSNSTTYPGGYGNVAIGHNAMKGGHTGSWDINSTFRSDYNVAIGWGALESIISHSSDKNTGVGVEAGDNISTGTNNTCLGNQARTNAATASNEVVLGNSSVSVLRCQVNSISGLSDIRDKSDIVNLPIGLDFVNKLRPVKFKWAMREESVHNGTTRAGFIAQELSEVQKGNEYINLTYETNPDRLEAQQGNLIPVLVQAIKDLSAKNDALEARIASLES